TLEQLVRFQTVDQVVKQAEQSFEEDILPMFAQGKLRPVIERVFAFEDLPAAQQAMRSNSHLGKLVLEVRA
ncbi:MAG: hypothetical protein EBX67_11625, partial [Betaproteobacteria bacterium]|nr:hypothetical protein [Betaproteobacteria bacterium]